MPLPTLKVELDGPTLSRGRVTLDGHEIGGLTELDISLAVGRVTTAKISLHLGALEIDAQTLAILQANVTVTEPATADDPELRTFGEEPCYAH